MPRENLTELRVRKAPVPQKPAQLELWDTGCPGLMFKVSFGGARTFFAVRYVAGKARMQKLGRYPILTLADARQAARKFLVDPEAAAKQEASKETFEAVLDKFVQRHIKGQGLRSAKNYEAYLRRHCKVWYSRPFEAIRRRDVADLMDQVEKEVSAKTADLLLAHISKLCNWYATRSDDYQTPIVKGMKRSKPNPRKRKLTDDEIRALWKVTTDLGVFGAIVRMLLLTAQRRAKIATMKWTDLSSDGIWTIATAPREKGNPGVLILPKAALEIIEARRRSTNSPYVFSNADAAFNQWSAYKAALDLKLTIPPWVLHDLRRTARSLMSRAGIQSEHSERVLGHSVGKPIEEVYDQHQYTEEKAAALVKLVDLINVIINPPTDNVVPWRAQALTL